MAAATQELITPWSMDGRKAPLLGFIQLANTTLWKGAVAMAVAGKVRPVAAAVANSTLLGVNETTRIAGGADVVSPLEDPIILQRGVFSFAAVSGDEPGDTELGKLIAFADDKTVKKTVNANDLQAIYLGRDADGLYQVEI